MQNFKEKLEGLSLEAKKKFLRETMDHLPKEDLFKLSEYVFLEQENELKHFLAEQIAEDPKRALFTARYLLTSNHPDDGLAVLKYYGARIITHAGPSLDHTTTIPMLVEAWDDEDYRDARWAISMAISKMINSPINTVLRSLKSNPEAEVGLLEGIKSYTSIDVSKFSYREL